MQMYECIRRHKMKKDNISHGSGHQYPSYTIKTCADTEYPPIPCVKKSLPQYGPQRVVKQIVL